MAKNLIQLQSKAHDRLTEFFSDHEDNVLNIEMLPPAFPPPDGICMREDLNLGLPKEILALSFLEARKIFFKHMKDGPLSAPASQSTKIILLFDPEYLTAANFRKRRLLHLQSLTSTSDPTATSLYGQSLDQELSFLTSILTSPLHRQSKSPTLWHHRYWLAKNHFLLNLSKPTTLDFLRSELNVVCKSGERHPNNYYAFQYARRVSALILDKTRAGPDHFPIPFPVDVLETLRNWCCCHPSDISGFSFLAWLLQRCEDPHLQRQVIGRIVNYAVGLHVSNESLWVFVRTVMADGTLSQGRGEVLQEMMKCLDESGGHGADKESSVEQKLRQTVAWIERYGGPVAPSLA